MALYKKVLDPNTGLTIEYHRINCVREVVNQGGTIQVCSYLSQADRERERIAIQNPDETHAAVYVTTSFYFFDYVDGITCTEAYEYLKTLPEFSGATDILEDTDENL